jgi:hypothetical protein
MFKNENDILFGIEDPNRIKFFEEMVKNIVD